jgi:hypothetical protein
VGSGTRDGGRWTLLTGHGHVLVEIARDPAARIRDISAACRLTERTVQAIVADLEAAGYITRTRAGRRTRYALDPGRPFRHPAQAGHVVGPFLALLAGDSGRAASPAPAPREHEAGHAPHRVVLQRPAGKP